MSWPRHRETMRKVRALHVTATLLGAAAAIVPARLAASGYSTGGTFLPLGHGARAHALGGAAIALVRDDAAAFWNPANLAWLEGRPGLTVMHAEILPGIDHGYDTFSFARGVGRHFGEEGQILRPTRWGYGLFLSHLGVDFEAGAWSESAVQVSAGLALSNYASLGVGLKLLHIGSAFEAGDATGGGLDLALTVLLKDHLSAAVVGRDLWTRLSYDTRTWETLAATLQAGLEYRWRPRWSAEADVMLRERSLQRVLVGVEWRALPDLLVMRGGWTALSAGETRAYPSAGAGLRWGRFTLDYAASFDDADALDIGQRMSLRVGL